jgi:hypothetical protein
MDSEHRTSPTSVESIEEIDRLASFLLKHFPDDIGDETAVDVAIRLLSEREKARRSAVATDEELRNAETGEFLGRLSARLRHLDDLYCALGVKWGEDPFVRIAELRGMGDHA